MYLLIFYIYLTCFFLIQFLLYARKQLGIDDRYSIFKSDFFCSLGYFFILVDRRLCCNTLQYIAIQCNAYIGASHSTRIWGAFARYVRVGCIYVPKKFNHAEGNYFDCIFRGTLKIHYT